MTKTISIPLLLFFLASCASEPPVATEGKCFSAKVIRIKDGDTVEVLTADKQTHSVRLAHIDTPEKKQPFGSVAKQALSDLCFGQDVQVCETDKPDRNGRKIAELVLADGRVANLLMVQQGLAWHYARYSEDQRYHDAEQAARAAGLGLWRADAETPVPPWEWRKKKKE